MIYKLKYSWKDLSRRDKTSIITAQVMRQILINGSNLRIGMREVNVNIGVHKPNLRLDVLEINRKKMFLLDMKLNPAYKILELIRNG